MNELEIKAAVRARDNFCCTECGLTQEEHYRLFGKNLEVHRVVPGSPYTVDGCVTLCQTCHDAKPISKHGSARLPNGMVRSVLTVPRPYRDALAVTAVMDDLTIGDIVMDLIDANPQLRERVEEIRRRSGENDNKKGSRR